MLGKLPQAHTCTNTLELPNYYESLQETGTTGVYRCQAEIRKVIALMVIWGFSMAMGVPPQNALQWKIFLKRDDLEVPSGNLHIGYCRI